MTGSSSKRPAMAAVPSRSCAACEKRRGWRMRWAVLLGCMLSAACRTRAATGTMDREHDKVRAATLRATARNVLDEAALHETYAVTWRWRLEVDQDGQAYSADVVRALGSEYACRAYAAGLNCSRRFRGDLVRLSLQLASQGAGTRVEAQLTALAD